MKKEYIFAGFGGQGMLLIGKFLAMACMLDGKHVSWLPSYGPEMRGGTANCSVIVSDDPVASPLVDMADCVVAMNRPSLDKFESHVKPGGVLVIPLAHGLHPALQQLPVLPAQGHDPLDLLLTQPQLSQLFRSHFISPFLLSPPQAPPPGLGPRSPRTILHGTPTGAAGRPGLPPCHGCAGSPCR